MWGRLDHDVREAVDLVSRVLPFRVNQYVIDELIDWDRVPEDPIFQLTFPQREMLDRPDLRLVRDAVASNDRGRVDAAVYDIRMRMNPHPAGQLTDNVPEHDGEFLRGLQHKYRETVLFFPQEGQTCHAYCTYCFRWPQFVNLPDAQFRTRDQSELIEYLRDHPEVTDVLFTGGDPLVMKTRVLSRYIEALLEADLPSLRTIRIGTKALAYWPQRFVTDSDSDDLMRLFEKVIVRGLHLAIMGHYSHPVELAPPIAREAVRRVRSTGAEIRMQAPLIRHVNDDPEVWADLWRTGVGLGMVPYYMFVERDTGPKQYFEVPLGRALAIFQAAYRRVSGLARTVRGPSMSAAPGKVRIAGVAEVGGESAFVLEFLQGRNPDWTLRPFFARYDSSATWLDDLEPMTGCDEFFFERELMDATGVLG